MAIFLLQPFYTKILVVNHHTLLKDSKHFKLNLLFLCTCMFECKHMCAMTRVWSLEDNFWESVLSFYHVPGIKLRRALLPTEPFHWPQFNIFKISFYYLFMSMCVCLWMCMCMWVQVPVEARTVCQSVISPEAGVTGNCEPPSMGGCWESNSGSWKEK